MMVWVPVAVRASLALYYVSKGLVGQVASKTSCFTRFLWIIVVSVLAFLSRVRHHSGAIGVMRRAVGASVLW